MIIHKSFIISILLFSGILLSNEEQSISSESLENSTDVEDLSSSSYKKDRRRIQLKPLYVPDHENSHDNKLNDVTENQNKSLQPNIENTQQQNTTYSNRPARWLLESSLRNAPELLKGICAYLLQSPNQHLLKNNVPSFHRLILVGPPGTGKTTLAHAIGYFLKYDVVSIPVMSFFGHYRNETSVRIKNMIGKEIENKKRKIIIIDELHKLFEHHTNDNTDHSQNAATFWLVLDFIEKMCPHVIVIGTANNVDKLPPEIKSRFSGRIINIPLPSKRQKIQAFKNSLINDKSIIIDKSIDDDFIDKVINRLNNCSLRDVQLIIDAAKMFNYAENINNPSTSPLLLTRKHLQKALDQIESESTVLQKSIPDRFVTHLNKWSIVPSFVSNLISITYNSIWILKILSKA